MENDEATILSHQRNVLYHQINEAYKLIDKTIRDLPACDCRRIYVERNLIDPDCIRCNAIDSNVYQGLVAWRNKFATPECRWMISVETAEEAV